MVRFLRDNNHDERPTDKMGSAQDQKRPKASHKERACYALDDKGTDNLHRR